LDFWVQILSRRRHHFIIFIFIGEASFFRF